MGFFYSIIEGFFGFLVVADILITSFRDNHIQNLDFHCPSSGTTCVRWYIRKYFYSIMTTNKRSIKKNYLYNMSYQVVNFILPLITTPYISRCLGVTNNGIYSYTSSIIAYFTLFAGFSFNLYGQKEIAIYRDDRRQQSIKFWEIQSEKLITVVIAYIAFILMINISESQYKNIFLIQSINIVAVLFDISFFYAGEENFKFVSIRNILLKVISAALVFAFVRSKYDLPTYVFINVFATIAANLSFWIGLNKKIDGIKFRDLRLFSDFKTLVELFIPMIATQVYNVLDKSMIGWTGNMAESAYYEQTTKIINICMAVTTSLGTVLFPRMANYFSEDKVDKVRATVKKAYNAIFFTAAPICFGIIGIAYFFVRWFFGPGYEKVSEVMTLYAFVLLIIPISNIAGYAVLTPSGNQNKGTLCVIIGAIVNFTLNSILIPKYYAVGASIATIIAESVVSVTHLLFIHKYVSFKGLFHSMVHYCIPAIIMFAVITIEGMLLNKIMIPIMFITIVQVITGIVIYVGILLLIKDSLIISLLKQIKVKIKR